MPELRTGDYLLRWDAPTPELLTIDALYFPGSKPPPMHLHPSQMETITVIEGRLQANIAGYECLVEAGTCVVIPSGTAHKMWNPFHFEAKTRWETRPALRTVEFLLAVHSARGLVARAALLHEFRDVFQASGVPAGLLRLVAGFRRE